MKSKIIKILIFNTGIILMIMNLGIWINGFFINRSSEMDIILALPLLVIGAFLLLGWYRTTGTLLPSKQQRKKFILRVFLINYGILYVIYMVADIIYSDAINFLSMPGIILPILLGLFIMGFILSWNYELPAGFFFIVWYSLLLFSSFKYIEILHRGPCALIGITILIHGILYITFHLRKKAKRM